jgi:hypothetical protein
VTATEPQTSYRPEDGMRRQASARQPRGFFISTEARPAIVTSEFWLTLIGAVALGIFAYASDALGVRWGMGFATAVLVAFILSRGIAKAGSSDVGRRTLDDLEQLRTRHRPRYPSARRFLAKGACSGTGVPRAHGDDE